MKVTKPVKGEAVIDFETAKKFHALLCHINSGNMQEHSDLHDFYMAMSEALDLNPLQAMAGSEYKVEVRGGQIFIENMTGVNAQW